MKILHLPNALPATRRLTGITIAALLALNATPNWAATGRSKATPDAAMAAAHAAAKGDGLLEALLTELDRSNSVSSASSNPSPFAAACAAAMAASGVAFDLPVAAQFGVAFSASKAAIVIPVNRLVAGNAF